MPLTVSKKSAFEIFNKASLLAAEKNGADLYLSAPGFPASGKSYLTLEPDKEYLVTEQTTRDDLTNFAFADDKPTFGYLTYNYGKLINGLKLKNSTSFPLGHLKKYRIVIEYDPESQSVDFNSTEAGNLWYDLTEKIALADKPENRIELSDISVSVSREEYIEKVRRTINYIREGYIYQLNLSIKYDVHLIDSGAYAVFAQLWQNYPAPFYAYLKSDKYQILSTSPERFLAVKDGRVLSQPIKGTLAFSQYYPEMKKILTDSPKESAELSMIIDMVRNDISRNCRVRSVEVSRHKSVFTVDELLQMYSDIKGQLAEKATVIDLLIDAFPGASITGCPKLKAMELIDEIEPHERDVYCGSFFIIKDHKNMESSVAIRTGYYNIRDNRLSFFAGSGIVADSKPEAEYSETMAKAEKFINLGRL